MRITTDIIPAVEALQNGGIIAYPTEAVYGLGCDPLNQEAVLRLLVLKKRPVAKGLILIAATWEQLVPYVEPVSTEVMAKVLSTWPGPFTWLFPVSPKTPDWIRGEHRTVAVRVTAHPIACALCSHFARPMVSTSANITGQAPARDADSVNKMFAMGVEVIVQGEVGGLLQPTEIRDVVTGKILR
ncbi:MAG TPA: L-threonylcarbamoyladenylate synthase [Gammaproteobacteria bacterium]|nr:L-threonylcarbamoyladenylate synthase [Gammaproteobacteria bacterium]